MNGYTPFLHSKQAMKIIKTSLLFSFLMAGMLFVSCSDDDETGGSDVGENVVVDVNKVFTGGMPKAVDDIESITLNANGLVERMTTRYEDITFEYNNVKTRSENNVSTVKMTLNSGEGEYSVLDMTLGSNGFVQSVTQTTHDLDGMETDYWQFKYNNDGQLIYMKRSEGGNEETFITYQDGDIVKVKQTSEDEYEDSWEVDILYTSSSVATPIVNKGCIMLFDETFNIDMDEMKYAYYAGLLGKATHHLPVGCKDDKYTEYYDWKLNTTGYPVSVSIDGYPYSFKW